MNRFFTLGGILGPLLFATTIVVVSILRPDYDHTTQFISELGATGGAWSGLMNYLGFMVSAILIMLFALSLRTSFSPTALGRVAFVLIGVYAAGMFLAGVFSCDVSCMPANPTREQVLHNLVSFIAFAALISGAFLWGVHLRKVPGWRGFGTYSLLTAALAIVLLGAVVNSAPTRDGAGLFQRGFLATLYLWMGLFAYRIRRDT